MCINAIRKYNNVLLISTLLKLLFPAEILKHNHFRAIDGRG